MDQLKKFFIYVFLISLVVIFVWFLLSVALPVMLAVAAVLAVVWGLQYGYEYLKDRYGKDRSASSSPKVIDTTFTKK